MNRVPTVVIVGEPEPLDLRRPPELTDHYVLSPYVVCQSGRFEMLLRLVNRDDDASKKVSRIHYASSTDGWRFDVGAEVIAPGRVSEPDGAGCEDATIVFNRGVYTAFYSGYNALQQRSSMLAATGTALTSLTKTGIVLEPDDAYANPKEAAFIATASGFRMFFEYARDGASHIGVADAPTLEGPWKYAKSPLLQRESAFDSWHLSPTSAIRRADGTHILIYNGASKKTDWSINYAVLDESATAVLERPEAPLLGPFGLDGDDTNIAFSASATVDSAGDVWLYYSIADRKPYRSRLRLEGTLADSGTREPA